MPFSRSLFKQITGMSVLTAALLTAYMTQAEPQERKCPGQRAGMHHMQHPMMMGAGMMPPFLRGLDLTEQQQDKVFELLHKQAPTMHANAKALKAAHDELRTLAQAQTFNAVAAKQAADKVGQAESAMALLHAQTDVQLRALLTPAQRDELNKRPLKEDNYPRRAFMQGDMPSCPMGNR